LDGAAQSGLNGFAEYDSFVQRAGIKPACDGIKLDLVIRRCEFAEYPRAVGTTLIVLGANPILRDEKVVKFITIRA
jgi:hypothetical protein